MIIAQVFALIAFILYVLSLQFREKKKTLLFQVIANVFYALEYLMLNAYAGVNNSLFGITRSLLFTVADKMKIKLPGYVAFVFIAMVIVFGFIAYTDIFSLIPPFVSCILFIALFVDNMRIFRLASAMAAGLWIIYNSVVGSYVGIGDSIVELISALIAIYRFDIKKVKKKNKDNIIVASN